MNHKSIAIIIPAFKKDFFEDTLISIVNQTDRDFNIYIGNDGGDREIGDLVEKYKGELNITYKYFNENIGKKDLVKSWERTFDLMQDEDYFIFFSDDDIFESNCIEEIRKSINENPDNDVFHFELSFIERDNERKVNKKGIYKKRTTSFEFYNLLIRKKIEARMPDFIFKTSTFKKNQGFVNFPLAIRSDNATVIKNSLKKPIIQVNAKVFWRRSNKNISANVNGNIEKIFYYNLSRIKYLEWIKNIFGTDNLNIWESLYIYISIVSRYKLDKFYNKILLSEINKPKYFINLLKISIIISPFLRFIKKVKR